VTTPAATSTADVTQAPYLTAPQVAALLQVDAKTIYRWAASEPTMPVLRVGGTVRFPRERLLKWLSDREQGRRRGAVTGTGN
jgi:excisionase family DNA binding protein